MDVSIVVTAKLDKTDIEHARINGGVPVPLPPNIRDYNSAKVMVSVVNDSASADARDFTLVAKSTPVVATPAPVVAAVQEPESGGRS